MDPMIASITESKISLPGYRNLSLRRICPALSLYVSAG